MDQLSVEDPQSFFNYSMVPAMLDELMQHTRDIVTGFELACHVDSPSNESRMFRMPLKAIFKMQ